MGMLVTVKDQLNFSILGDREQELLAEKAGNIAEIHLDQPPILNAVSFETFNPPFQIVARGRFGIVMNGNNLNPVIQFGTPPDLHQGFGLLLTQLATVILK